jgi:nucleoside-diphosphate-sugar epimerase
VYGVGMNRFGGAGDDDATWAAAPIQDLVEGAVRGERVRIPTGGAHPRDYTHGSDIGRLVVAVLEGPADSDRIFYGATGEPLVTATEVAQLVSEIVPGADVAIGTELSDAERPVMALRGRLSVENAREQLAWEPRYRIEDGLRRYAEDYGRFLLAGGRSLAR